MTLPLLLPVGTSGLNFLSQQQNRNAPFSRKKSQIKDGLIDDNQTPHTAPHHTKEQKRERSRFLDFFVWCGNDQFIITPSEFWPESAVVIMKYFKK